MIKLFNEYMDLIDSRQAKPGDVFLVRYSPRHWHCMVVSKREEKLETEFEVIEAGRDGVVSHRIDHSTKRRIHSCYRVRGIVD